MTLYEYRLLNVSRVVDGDTFDGTLDLGFTMAFGSVKPIRFRILGCDAPERHEPGHDECTALLVDWLAAGGRNVIVNTVKTDSFGRWLANVYTPTSDFATELTELMHANGWTSEAVR